jgi:hypothetical protein
MFCTGRKKAGEKIRWCFPALGCARLLAPVNTSVRQHKFNKRYSMTNFLLRTINIEKYVTSQVKELLSNEEKYIRQRVDMDIKNMVVGKIR